MTLIKTILLITISLYLLDKYGYTGCCDKIKINWNNIAIIIPIISILTYIMTIL